MQGLTFVFHVFSACVILGMTLWIIRISGQNHFQQRLWQSISGKKQPIYVDWPVIFLEKFCQSIGARFHRENSAKGSPCQILTQTWVKAHIDFNIISMRLDNNDMIEVEFSHQPDDIKGCVADLKKAMPRITDVSILYQGKKL